MGLTVTNCDACRQQSLSRDTLVRPEIGVPHDWVFTSARCPLGRILMAAIAVVCGGLLGAFGRVLLDRALGRRTSSGRSWFAELAVACVHGAGIAVLILLVVNARGWAVAGFGAGSTTYAAASAALAYLREERTDGNPRWSALMHFAGTYLAALVGFLVVIGVTRFFPAGQ